MPPGSSMERTTEVMQRIDSLLRWPAIESRTMIVGYSFSPDKDKLRFIYL